jgi:hypothetical protein
MKYVLLFLSALLGAFLPVTTIRARQELRGCIKIQGMGSSTVPRFRVLYDGKETISNSEGFYTLPLDDQDEKKYFLLICPSVNQNFERSNTVNGVHIAQNTPRRFFTFQKNGWGGYGDVQESTLEDNAIPLHCVVLLLDPTYIEMVQNWESSLSNSVVKIPLIMIKNSIDRNKLEQASAASLLGSLELVTFHESIKESSKKVENPKVSLALAQ